MRTAWAPRARDQGSDGLHALTSLGTPGSRLLLLAALVAVGVGAPSGTAAPVIAETSPLAFLEPDGVNDKGDIQFEIRWLDGNVADGTVSLFYDEDGSGVDGTLIVRDIPASDPTNSYHWNTAIVPPGDYFVYAVFRSPLETSTQYSPGTVSIQQVGCLDLASRTNLIPNASFDDGSTRPTDWNVSSPDPARGRSWEYQWLNDPSQAHSGSRSLTIANTFNAGAWQDRVIVAATQRPFPVVDGKYLLTGWIRTEDVEAGHVLMKIKYYDANGTQLALTGHGSDDFRMGGPQTTEWTQVAFLIRPPHWDSPPYPKPARAIRFAVNLSLDHSPGRVWFDDLGLFELGEEEYERSLPGNRYPAPDMQETDVPVSLPGIAGWSTTIQQHPSTGDWWIVGADGSAYWGLGASSTSANEKLLAATGMTSSNYSKEAKYRLKADLNFNVGWVEKTGPASYSGTHNNITWLNFTSEQEFSSDPSAWMMKDRDGVVYGEPNHRFADPFNPIWQENARLEAESLSDSAGWTLENPDLIGYWTDNEIAFGELYDYLWGEVAKLAFVDWLQGLNELPSVDAVYAQQASAIDLDVPAGFGIAHPYATIGDLDRAWTSSHHVYAYTAFREVHGGDKPYIRSFDDPVAADLYAFERVVYKIYVDTIINNIRRVEDEYLATHGTGFHHAIFSNRFAITGPVSAEGVGRSMDIFGRFDAIGVNLYPNYNNSGTYHPRELLEFVKRYFYDTTGKPLYVAEFGIAAEDADDVVNPPYLIVQRWRPKTVERQDQRGWGYQNLISTWANLPYMIGADWFMWSNGYGENGSDPRNSGIVDDRDRYYVPLADNIRSVNARVNRIRRSGSFTLEAIDWSAVEIPFCSGAQPTFADVPLDHPFHDDIEILYQNGYTAGCAVAPPRYCPEQTMNRAESAVFVERGLHTAAYEPPTPTSQTFADLALDSWASKWVEGLWADGYTSGCGTNPMIYCPWQGHTRAEGCVFYLRMLNGADYLPPQPSQQVFADVPLDTWYAGWAQAAHDAGLLNPCQTWPELRFCPDDPLTRALAAHMMVKAKELP
jgi:hypothetical protein